MLSQIKSLFASKSPFNKQLIQSSLLVDADEIDIEDLVYIIKKFELHPQLINEYLDIVMKGQLFESSYYIRSKTLLTAHLILHDRINGEDFARVFLELSFPLTPKKKVDLKDKKTWLTENIQVPYYQYLQRLAANIQVFLCCKVNTYPATGNLNTQNRIIWLFKISNIVQICVQFEVNFSFAQMESIMKALMVNSHETLLKEIVLVYWSDIIVYYQFLSDEVAPIVGLIQILNLLEQYRNLAVKICLQFYELYIQLLELRNKVRNLYKFRIYFNQDQVIQQPILFDVRKVKLKEVEKHVEAIQNLSLNLKSHSLDVSKSKRRLNNTQQARSIDVSLDDSLSNSQLGSEDRENVKKMFAKKLQNKIQDRLHTLEEEQDEHNISITITKVKVSKVHIRNKTAFSVVQVLEGRSKQKKYDSDNEQ